MAVVRQARPIHVDPGPEGLSGLQGCAVKFTGVALFVIVERFQRVRWLAKLVQFAADNVFRASSGPHPGIPTDAI
jgi:hypothetical protein